MGTRLEHDVENLTGKLVDESALTPFGTAVLRLLVDVREQLPVSFVPVDQEPPEVLPPTRNGKWVTRTEMGSYVIADASGWLPGEFDTERDAWRELAEL